MLHRKKNKAAGVCRAKRYPAAERAWGEHRGEKGDRAGEGEKYWEYGGEGVGEMEQKVDEKHRKN